MPDIDVPNSFLRTIDIGLQGLLFSKFSSILKLEDINTGIVNFPKEISLREIAEKRGNVELEYMSMFRKVLGPDWSRGRTPASRRGFAMDYTNANKTDATWLKAVPAKMKYEVTFYTKYWERLNLIAERYLFWQHESPVLDMKLNVEYDQVNFEYDFKLHLHFNDLEDESTIREKFDKGAIYCMSTTVDVDGIVLIADSMKVIKSIILTVYDQDGLATDADFSEVIVEDSNQDAELEIALKLYTRTYT